LPANWDRMQSTKSDGRVNDDITRTRLLFNVNTMSLRERTVRARRQQQTVSAGVGGLLAVLEEQEFLDLAYGSYLVPSTVQSVNFFLTRCFAGEALIGCRYTRLRTQQVECEPYIPFTA
jgi:hypothetical protein